MQRLLTRFLLLIMVGSIYAADSESLSYEKPVSLTGTIVREFDMSFVDSDLGPIQDPKEVARAVAEARRKHPIEESKPHEPFPHFILRLEKPISLRAESADGLHPEERNISEIDLGGSVQGVTEKDLGKTRFVVSGTLSDAMTVHHLRPVIMQVITLKRVR
ncbi:hypothetical protein ACXR0O_00785 [Verrucomicrobiota bacterium sgz303538]